MRLLQSSQRSSTASGRGDGTYDRWVRVLSQDGDTVCVSRGGLRATHPAAEIDAHRARARVRAAARGPARSRGRFPHTDANRIIGPRAANNTIFCELTYSKRLNYRATSIRPQGTSTIRVTSSGRTPSTGEACTPPRVAGLPHAHVHGTQTCCAPTRHSVGSLPMRCPWRENRVQYVAAGSRSPPVKVQRGRVQQHMDLARRP